MIDPTDAPTPSTNLEAVKLQPDMTPRNPQICPAEVAVAVLTPSAARAVTAGENAAEFCALVEAVTEFWNPQDVFERVLMSDFIYAEWELRRLRRLVPAAFAAGRPFAVSKLDGYPEDQFSDSAFPSGGYQQALDRLAAKGHTVDILDAQTLLMHTAAFESFDKRMTVLEVRRDGAWEKVERRRSATKANSSPL